jgi:hypothetical protein
MQALLNVELGRKWIKARLGIRVLENVVEKDV